MLFDISNRFRPAALAAGLFVLGSAALHAGGFFLTIGNPAANRDPMAKGALFLVRPDGCHEPAKADVRATAEGLVDGRRVSLPLKPVALSTPGTYAIRREWPAGGAWVVGVTATYGVAKTAALVPIGSEGARRDLAKVFTGEPSKKQIEALLRDAGSSLQAGNR
jgi:hypothetical protein